METRPQGATDHLGLPVFRSLGHRVEPRSTQPLDPAERVALLETFELPRELFQHTQARQRSNESMHDVLSSSPAAAREESKGGQPVKRVEDLHLITGQGRYLDDLKLPGLLSLRFVRSIEAHARILTIDTSRAAAADGVRLVLTGSEINRRIRPLPVRWATPGLRCRDYRCMADDRVRYVGQPVALVVADDPYLAEDAAVLVEVAYDPLPPVVDVEAATAPGAPLLYPEWGTNETCEPVRLGQGESAAAFAQADRVIKAWLYSHRCSGFPLETRGCLAVPNPTEQLRQRIADTVLENECYRPVPHQVEQLLTVYSSTQAPNQVRTALADCLGVGKNSIRVKAWDVGGGFGVKDQMYPEEVMGSYVAWLLAKPVKWVEDRTESFLASTHAREQVHDADENPFSFTSASAIMEGVCAIYRKAWPFPPKRFAMWLQSTMKEPWEPDELHRSYQMSCFCLSGLNSGKSPCRAT